MFLHPYNIKLHVFFLSDPCEPAAFGKSVLLMKGDASGVQGGDTGQDMADTHLNCFLFEQVEGLCAEAFSGLGLFNEITDLRSLSES